jgi:hypothetical protein
LLLVALLIDARHLRRGAIAVSDESRAAATARGRLALCALRHERASAIEAAAPADTVRRRRATRGVALLGLAAQLAAGLLLAPVLASQVGSLH